MKTAFMIAWRFLAASKGQSLLIAIGIAVGVSVQVFIGSLISGLQVELVDNAIGRNTQITVTARDRGDYVEEYQEVAVSLEAAGLGLKLVSPVLDASGFLRVKEEDYPILLRGFASQNADGIYRLTEALASGALPDEGQVALGINLAQEAGIEVMDTVTLATPRGAPGM